MRARSSARSDPGFLTTLFRLIVAFLLFSGCAVMPALSQAQVPVMVRTPSTLIAAAKGPVAGFTADVTSGMAPLTVRFTDTSLNNPTSWSWDLDGDGRSDSQASNPVFTYPVPGSYTVRLTVTNGAGTDTVVKQGFVSVRPAVPEPPVAGFSARPVRGTVPLIVRFTDESQNNPTAWWWDFTNDGIPDSREKNPVWTYTEPGIYTVRLTVSSDAGKDDVLEEGAITVLAPITAGSTVTSHTVTAPVTSLPSAPITLPRPDNFAGPPGFPWLTVAIMVAIVLAGGYLVLRGRSSRKADEREHDLHFELTGRIEYGEDAGDDLLESVLDEMEERSEEPDGRT